ncbi:MAG: hypothetical protein H7A21_17525 [Spirochaetales bacterium]|nr:hypothetical protein [Leptospiraceae bacterium]MCP5483243.1 hypothetical protein [Spirochaetales bacterium]
MGPSKPNEPPGPTASSARPVFILVGLLFAFTIFSGPLHAVGDYAQGHAVVRIDRLEESGIFFNSYEGVLSIAGYDEDEECEADQDECYAPMRESLEFSVDDDNRQLVRYLENNIGKVMLVQYRVHRMTLAFSSDFEIENAWAWEENPPDGISLRETGTKEGSRRAFTIFGRVLRFEERGTMIDSYEGLYYNAQTGKVHPFSVTDESLAVYIRQIMRGSRQFYMRIAEAYVAPTRDSDYQLYAIDFERPPDTTGGDEGEAAE